MTPAEVCREVANDVRSDVVRFEGQSFNGKTVAEYLGCQAAAIEALANILEKVLSGEIVLGGEK